VLDLFNVIPLSLLRRLHKLMWMLSSSLHPLLVGADAFPFLFLEVSPVFGAILRSGRSQKEKLLQTRKIYYGSESHNFSFYHWILKWVGVVMHVETVSQQISFGKCTEFFVK